MRILLSSLVRCSILFYYSFSEIYWHKAAGSGLRKAYCGYVVEGHD